MMKTNNDNLLKVENLEQNEYLVTSSIIDEPKEKIEEKQEKISVIGLFISAISLKRQGKDKIYSKIRPVKTLKLILVLTVICALLYLFYKLVDPKVILPIILIFSSIACPFVAMTFHYEICPQKGTSLFQLIFSFIFGILLYISINALSRSVLITIIYESTINIIIVPILWGIGELLFIAILAKMYNITDPAVGILLAVSVGVGYAFTWTMHELFSCFFIPVEIIMNGGVEHYIGEAIVDEASLLLLGFENMFSKILRYSLYYSTMIACWSVVIGSVTSLTELFKTNRKEKPISIYLMLVLVILLYALSVFNTTFSSFDIILKALCFVVSLIVAYKIENNALTHTVDLLNGDKSIKL